MSLPRTSWLMRKPRGSAYMHHSCRMGVWEYGCRHSHTPIPPYSHTAFNVPTTHRPTPEHPMTQEPDDPTTQRPNAPGTPYRLGTLALHGGQSVDPATNSRAVPI